MCKPLKKVDVARSWGEGGRGKRGRGPETSGPSLDPPTVPSGGGGWILTYLSISRGIPATKCACDNDNHLFVFKVASVVVLHTLKLRRKNTTKHIVDDVGIVTGTSRLSGIQDSGFDSALVVLAEDASSVTNQPVELIEMS